MLTCSKLALPKIAMVFDDDVDIWDDNAVKLGMDRTIPMGPQFTRPHFDRSTVCVPEDPPANVVVLTQSQLTEEMSELINDAPRTWKEIREHFNGQPYPVICRAFSNLRPGLGRCDDAPWYRYTFSDSDFAADVPLPKESNYDPRHAGRILLDSVRAQRVSRRDAVKRSRIRDEDHAAGYDEGVATLSTLDVSVLMCGYAICGVLVDTADRRRRAPTDHWSWDACGQSGTPVAIRGLMSPPAY